MALRFGLLTADLRTILLIAPAMLTIAESLAAPAATALYAQYQNPSLDYVLVDEHTGGYTII